MCPRLHLHELRNGSQFTGIHALEMKEVPMPIPGPLQVLVKVYAVSLQVRLFLMSLLSLLSHVSVRPIV